MNSSIESDKLKVAFALKQAAQQQIINARNAAISQSSRAVQSTNPQLNSNQQIQQIEQIDFSHPNVLVQHHQLIQSLVQLQKNGRATRDQSAQLSQFVRVAHRQQQIAKDNANLNTPSNGSRNQVYHGSTPATGSNLRPQTPGSNLRPNVNVVQNVAQQPRPNAQQVVNQPRFNLLAAINVYGPRLRRGGTSLVISKDPIKPIKRRYLR